MADRLQSSSSPKSRVAQPSVHHCTSPLPTLSFLPRPPPAHLPPTLLVLPCTHSIISVPTLSLPACARLELLSVATHCRWPDSRLCLWSPPAYPQTLHDIAGPRDGSSEKTNDAKGSYFSQSPLKCHLSHRAFDMPPFNIFYI